MKRMRMMLAVLCAVGSIGLTGCGAGSTGAPAAVGTGRAPGAAVRCAAAPPSLISADLSVPVTAVQETVSGSTLCQYTKGSDPASAVSVDFVTTADASEFGVARTSIIKQFGPVTDVAGLGDEAFASTTTYGGRTLTNELLARKGSLQIQVGSAATVDQEKMLITHLFGVLSQ